MTPSGTDTVPVTGTGTAEVAAVVRALTERPRLFDGNGR